ncbi:hypothetical protein SUDANB176_02670 [Streptomyces sp. enrichment culture]
MRLGAPEEVPTDNGKRFTARFRSGLAGSAGRTASPTG